MIPSALTSQLQQGLADFLRFSFWSSTPGMEQVVEDLLAEEGALLKGPYLSLKLPFVSGSNPRYFPDLPLGFLPHLHQEQAFARLGGRRKLSTLVATGTGSGKTESFLLPILDHCLRDAHQPGIKAILIYPMNALATDQAGRIARFIHGTESLRGRITAGLFIGDDRKRGATGLPRMGPESVITDRATMQDVPPNILLTNYKMLDYLLLRPDDQKIWQHNVRGTLRFLVVDEIHTFDGAQGTDLACLLRRIKRRLQVDDGSLCCVGTSATLGGPEAGQELRAYAEAVFGEPFDEQSVIGEARVDDATFFSGCDREWTLQPGPDDMAALDPARATDSRRWLAEQERLWFGDGGPESTEYDDEWAVALADKLKRHAMFQSLVTELHGGSVELEALVRSLARRHEAWREDAELARLSLLSLVALVSAARTWRARHSDDEPRRVQPFLEVRLQLWQREMRRMVATVGARPRLRHWMDLDQESRQLHLPMVHCRDCGSLGWAALVQRDKPRVLRTDLDPFYRAYFGNDARVEFLYPAAAAPEGDAVWAQRIVKVDTERLVVLGPEEETSAPTLEVVRPANTRSTAKGQKLVRDCPFCASAASLTLIGFRAATLTSVNIDQLFASVFNDDKKLLTFSDSVQDAAHRAGFFGARTWRSNLRIAMLRWIRQNDGRSLADLADELGSFWRQELDEATWVATFLAPNLAAEEDWDYLRSHGALPKRSNLPELIQRRLAFEVCFEFGVHAGIGRSLPRTGTAAVQIDPARLESALGVALEPLRNEVPGLRDVSALAVRRLVVGLLHHLRLRGGILARSLPGPYVESAGDDVNSFWRNPALPGFHRGSRLPLLLTDRSGVPFETWSGGKEGERSWYRRWVLACFGGGQALSANAASIYPVLLPILVREGLLRQQQGKKGEGLWGLDEAALLLTPQVASVICDGCGHRAQVAIDEVGSWSGMPCLTARCRGVYGGDPEVAENYFGRLYGSGDLQRIFAEEHTGLLGRGERERVEFEFKSTAEATLPEARRRPWYANLLSCTPTLEMGIDIGDLSTAILCSVPPGQANYLQRIGRAGRRDGNAFVLTVAEAAPHDLYFFSEPKEMIAGAVDPPGVFLDAPAVLERQLTAFCVDRWVATEGADIELPRVLRKVFRHLDDEGGRSFPRNLIRFVDSHQSELLREIFEMFGDALSDETRGHLQRFLEDSDDRRPGLRRQMVDALRRERDQRDSLAAKASTLRKQIQTLEAAEAKAVDHEEEVEQREAEKEALLGLVKDINDRRTLEFLTTAGLLPNYAFPEAAVRLRSVIWRKRKTAPDQAKKYQTWSYEYQRSPASALSELAPGADFYASGRRVLIDEVDLSVSEVESWRFCSECNHAECIDTGDDLAACPVCHSAGWSDTGQRFRLLELQQVVARTQDRASRIRDERDDREPRFFQRQILVAIDPRQATKAWRLADERFPFGFELLDRATFRDVNFGEMADQGPRCTIAGREAVRPGFELCSRCGKVQTSKDEPQHTFACPSRKEGAKPQIESCLYLYRHFESEALRLLLPMADLLTTKALHSFIAALQLGLKARFGGSVDHLRTMVYSDPVAGSALRRHYLVLYDTVPGGTGYLRQLVSPKEAGGTMPLFEALALAKQRIERCSCWVDPERDGCYRCLYAYRNSREMDDTSARSAQLLLAKILERADRLEEIPRLSDISVSSLLDSVLEARFLEALQRITDSDGRVARLDRALPTREDTFRWTLGDLEWTVQLQVEPPVSETAGVPVSIDFVLRPTEAGDSRRLAVFLDGWEFHNRRIDIDLRQRMALQATGWDVWSLTWADIDAELSGGPATQILDLLGVEIAAVKAFLQQKAQLQLADRLHRSTFDWLTGELLTAGGQPWQQLGAAVLASRMAHATGAEVADWRRFVAAVAPPVARSSLNRIAPRLVGRGADQVPGNERPSDTQHLFAWMAVHDGTAPALLCSLDDREENLHSVALQSVWQGYLRLFQILRQTPHAWFMTARGSGDGEAYGAIARALESALEVPPWDDLEDVRPEYRALAESLVAAGVEEPAVGLDVPDRRGLTWSEAEFAWAARKVAVTSYADTALVLGAADDSWKIFFLEDLAADPTVLIDALLDPTTRKDAP